MRALVVAHMITALVAPAHSMAVRIVNMSHVPRAVISRDIPIWEQAANDGLAPAWNTPTITNPTRQPAVYQPHDLAAPWPASRRCARLARLGRHPPLCGGRDPVARPRHQRRANARALRDARRP